MEIGILRHAIAEDRALGLRDDERALTEDGAQRMREAARGMRALGLRFDRIWTSPLARARQTAEIVAEALEAHDVLEEIDELGHAFSRENMVGRLSSAGASDRVLLVGHQPDLGELISYLLTGSDDVYVPLKKGALCLVETDGPVEPGAAALIWLLAPKHLRALGKGK
jgi:phosphohistidine phosphatase